MIDAMVARRVLLLAAAGLLVACSHDVREAATKDELESAHTEILNARAAHVEDYAAPEMKAAEAKYQQAKHATDPQEVRDLAREAQALADLAIADARSIRGQANRAAVMRQLGMPEPGVADPAGAPDAGEAAPAASPPAEASS